MVTIEKLIKTKKSGLAKVIEDFLKNRLKPFVEYNRIEIEVENYQTSKTKGVYITLNFKEKIGYDFNKTYRNSIIKECRKYIRKL